MTTSLERHFTVTAYILKNKQVFLLFHPKHQKWLPPGGHLEPGETPPQGVLREVLEETGMHIALISQENLWLKHDNAESFERPYLCLLENIPAYKDVPAHQHMDLVYLARPLEQSGVEDSLGKWFTLEEVEALKSEEEIFEETKKTIRHILASFGEL